MKYRAQILIVNGSTHGVVHGECGCVVDLTSRGTFDTFEEAAKAASIGGRTAKPCPISFPHGRPVFHAVSGALVGYINGTKFFPID